MSDNNFNKPFNKYNEEEDVNDLFQNEEEQKENIQTEKNEFTEPDHEFNWKHVFQNSYHFKQDIERVWLIVRSFDLLSFLSCKGHYPCIFIKGEDTWKLGNIFKGNFFGISPFVARVNESINLPEIKKLEWLFNRENEYFIIGLELLKVTEDNSTVVIRELKFEKEFMKNDLEIIQQQIVSNITFEEVEKILEKEPINLLKYESGIINGKMKDIWDLITDFNKLTAIAPNNNYLPNISIKEMKVGEKKEVTAFYNDKIRKFDITLKCKEEKPGWNKWLVVCEISGGNPDKLPKHIILFQLTKISNNESQLTLLTKYFEPIETTEFKKITDKKKYLLLCIKDYFDNFYTPSNSS